MAARASCFRLFAFRYSKRDKQTSAFESGSLDSNLGSLLVEVRRLGGGVRSLSTVYMYNYHRLGL